MKKPPLNRTPHTMHPTHDVCAVCGFTRSEMVQMPAYPCKPDTYKPGPDDDGKED